MSSNKIWSILPLLAITSLLLAACGGTATEAPTAETFKAAVILSGPWDDNSWNEAAWNAIHALEDEGVEIATAEVPEGDEARLLGEWTEQGFDLIIGHGFGYQDGLFTAAEEFPDISFAWAGGLGRTGPNIIDYDAPFYEAAYPIGIIAGHVSETGVLGAIYGFDIPICHAMGEALLAGAQTVNPDAQLISTATGDWIDVAKAKEAALAQADAGVDYWIECGEGPALGTIEAAEEAGGWVTGYVGDMTENGPDVVLVNLIWNLEPLYKELVQEVINGTFGDKYYQPGIADGVMQISYSDNLRDQIPPEAIEAADAAMEAVRVGELEIPFIPE